MDKTTLSSWSAIKQPLLHASVPDKCALCLQVPCACKCLQVCLVKQWVHMIADWAARLVSTVDEYKVWSSARAPCESVSKDWMRLQNECAGGYGRELMANVMLSPCHASLVACGLRLLSHQSNMVARNHVDDARNERIYTHQGYQPSVQV